MTQAAGTISLIPFSGYCVASQYQLEHELGRGKMGIVWRAFDSIGDRLVCIKFLPPELVCCPQETSRMKNCFQLMHDVQHANLCPMYLYGTDPQFGPYHVMRFVKGQSLAEMILDERGQRRRFRLGEITQLLTPIAFGLDYLHARGLVHRDVKPANIMAGSRRQPSQLIDFGLTEIFSRLPHASGSVVIVGSGAYLAPEIWRGQPASPPSDQHALATIVYEMLAGRRPFEHSIRPNQLMRSAITEQIPWLQGISAEINEILLRALSKNPADRFPSCRHFMRSLKNKIPVAAPVASLMDDQLAETIVPGQLRGAGTRHESHSIQESL